jgi:hypothetical protein
MSSESKGNLSSEGNLRGTTESPTTPGTYWFQSETMPRAMMVEVRVTNGQLTACWPNLDVPVAKLNGHWRGPILSFSGPGDQVEDSTVDLVVAHAAKASRSKRARRYAIRNFVRRDSFA